MGVGKKIKVAREKLGLSMNQLSKRSEVGQSTLSYIESGQRQPTYDVIERICNGLGMTVSEFFNEDYEPKALTSDVNTLLSKTETLSQSQQDIIKNLLSAAQNITDEFISINQLHKDSNTKNKSAKTSTSHIEILDLLDKPDVPITAGGRPLTLEERVELLELLKEKIMTDAGQAPSTGHKTAIAASHQGESVTQHLSKEDEGDIRKAMEFAEKQHKRKK